LAVCPAIVNRYTISVTNTRIYVEPNIYRHEHELTVTLMSGIDIEVLENVIGLS
jgi:hypothetical protein